MTFWTDPKFMADPTQEALDADKEWIRNVVSFWNADEHVIDTLIEIFVTRASSYRPYVRPAVPRKPTEPLFFQLVMKNIGVQRWERLPSFTTMAEFRAFVTPSSPRFHQDLLLLGEAFLKAETITKDLVFDDKDGTEWDGTHEETCGCKICLDTEKAAL